MARSMPHDTANIMYRPMTEADIPAGADISQFLRWPHRSEDWHFIFRLGAGIVAEAGGEIVGMALYFMWSSNSASLGGVMVHPSMQGRGIGRALMVRTMDALGDRVIFLNATAEGRPLYQKLGFAGTSGLIQFQGLSSSVTSTRSETSLPLPHTLLSATLDADQGIRPFISTDSTTITSLFNQACGMDRTIMLAALLEVAECIVLQHDQEISGFALIRPFGRGFVIGPVVAATTEDAYSLIKHLAESKQGEFVRVDIRVEAGQATPLAASLQALGLAPVDTGLTMARGKPPAAKGKQRVFAIANQALG